MHALRARASEVRIARYAFGRRFGMQLKGQPGEMDQSLPLELLDSDRVDVAPGSNVVGEDDEVDRDCRAHRLIHTPFEASGFLWRSLTCRWQNGGEGGGAQTRVPCQSRIQEVRIWQTRRRLSSTRPHGLTFRAQIHRVRATITPSCSAGRPSPRKILPRADTRSPGWKARMWQALVGRRIQTPHRRGWCTSVHVTRTPWPRRSRRKAARSSHPPSLSWTWAEWPCSRTRPGRSSRSGSRRP